MELHELPKLKGVQKAGRRLGRGRRSTKGKTSGHGVKGQSVRNRLKLRRLQTFKRFPFLRGKSLRRVDWSVRPVTVSLSACNTLEVEVVTPQVLLEAGVITNLDRPIKILGTGTFDKKLQFSSDLSFSRNARSKIEDAGGTIVA